MFHFLRGKDTTTMLDDRGTEKAMNALLYAVKHSCNRPPLSPTQQFDPPPLLSAIKTKLVFSFPLLRIKGRERGGSKKGGK